MTIYFAIELETLGYNLQCSKLWYGKWDALVNFIKSARIREGNNFLNIPVYLRKVFWG